jgi:tetratricopeptide (TPR) repeat protein
MPKIPCCFAALLIAGVQIAYAGGQGYPSGPGTGGIGRAPGGGGGLGAPGSEIVSAPPDVKPEKAAAKAFAAGNKTMAKARELQEIIAHSSDPEKRAKAGEKLDDAYDKALLQYTEVIRYNNTMYEPWNQIGFIHLHYGAYRESIDDYNHALALKPDLPEAIAHRGAAYLGADRLDEAKAVYMDLFFHNRQLADELMVAMQAWVQAHQASPNGVRVADVDAFGKWVEEREGIAKATASAAN